MLRLYLYRFRRMRVYALVGESGTGKSFRARYLVEKYKIDLLIDDGLIISDEKIICGSTSKNQDNIMDAVRMAIFDSETHRQAARDVLDKTHFHRVLVLGTSERMVYRICDALYLHRPGKIINIEDISTEKEIAKSRQHRERQGSHVVPVPSLELKQSFPDLVTESLNVFIKRGFGLFRRNAMYQKSLVRPAYNRQGSVLISDKALREIAEHCIHDLEPRIKVTGLRTHKSDNVYNFWVHVSVPQKGINLAKTLPKIQSELISSIQEFSGIIIRKLRIIIDTVKYGK